MLWFFQTPNANAGASTLVSGVSVSSNSRAVVAGQGSAALQSDAIGGSLIAGVTGVAAALCHSGLTALLNVVRGSASLESTVSASFVSTLMSRLNTASDLGVAVSGVSLARLRAALSGEHQVGVSVEAFVIVEDGVTPGELKVTRVAVDDALEARVGLDPRLNCYAVTSTSLNGRPVLDKGLTVSSHRTLSVIIVGSAK